MAPQAVERTPLEKDRHPDPRAVVDRVALDVEDERFVQQTSPLWPQRH